MADIIKMFHGRRKRGKALPKPILCSECDEPIETARLQVMPKAKRCISCEQAREARHNRILSSARDRDIVIIRG